MKFIFGWKGIAVAVAILLALVGVFINLRVNYKNYYDPFIDFEFRLDFDAYGRSGINTFNNTITKDLVLGGNVVTDYILSERQRMIIFNKMSDMDIMSYGSDLNYGVYDFQHPENLTLIVHIGAEEKTIYWSVPWSFSEENMKKLSEEQIEFLELVNYIKRIVYKSKEYKSLPKHVGGYL